MDQVAQHCRCIGLCRFLSVRYIPNQRMARLPSWYRLVLGRMALARVEPYRYQLRINGYLSIRCRPFFNLTRPQDLVVYQKIS